MSLHYDDIGKRLRAFRLASGLSAEEVARRIGISRTAFYRCEKGEVTKIETLDKLSELLGISTATLLGVGIEYISSAVAYFERLRQIEDEAQNIVVLAGPISYLLASDKFDVIVEQILRESMPGDHPDIKEHLANVDTILGILKERKANFRRRAPSVVTLMSGLEVERLLRNGFLGRVSLPPEERAKRLEFARSEVLHFADLIVRQPIGIQIGIIPDALPTSGFQLFKTPDRRLLSLSPFRLGESPNIRVGVAMITSAEEALTLHDRSIRMMWDGALKGQNAADYLRELVAASDRNNRMMA
jgi:transcriptional regulator with XRE-family HTH domain